MISKLNVGAQEGSEHVRSSGIAMLIVMGVQHPLILTAKAPVGWPLLGRTHFPSY